MAKLEKALTGDFNQILSKIEKGIIGVTMFQSGAGPIHLSAITSGGSQAMFFKMNTMGEEAFLDKLRELL